MLRVRRAPEVVQQSLCPKRLADSACGSELVPRGEERSDQAAIQYDFARGAGRVVSVGVGPPTLKRSLLACGD